MSCHLWIINISFWLAVIDNQHPKESVDSAVQKIYASMLLVSLVDYPFGLQ